MVDPDRIEQAIVNLLSNGLKFGPPGSVVDVDATCDGEEVRLAIRDRGPGIRSEDMPWLFGKFRQLDASPARKTSGTGLGLVITKSLVESHGGRIEVESQLEQGSTFTIVLPIERSQGRGTRDAGAHQV
jgi:signal transduction histidine kinase